MDRQSEGNGVARVLERAQAPVLETDSKVGSLKKWIRARGRIGEVSQKDPDSLIPPQEARRQVGADSVANTSSDESSLSR